MKAGIVGLPNVGKSTLFNALGTGKAQVANFPFCTIEPNLGVVSVPDRRLEALADLVQPERVVPAGVEIVDIAGLVEGASQGEGLGSQFLANIKETDAILHVLRCFESDTIIHVNGGVDPIRDKNIIDTELQLKDLASVEKQLVRAKKAKQSTDKASLLLVDALEQAQAQLSAGNNIRQLALSEEMRSALAPLRLLTAKPVIYICNVDEAAVQKGNAYAAQVQAVAATEGAACLLVSAAVESEIADMDSADRAFFLAELGLEESGLARLIRKAYATLSYITYFTCGQKEVRAWTIRKGSTAPEAAGVIHGDFQRGFIRAEIIAYEDFIHGGSEAVCRDQGKIRIEGKEYIMQDGDIAHFRFNV